MTHRVFVALMTLLVSLFPRLALGQSNPLSDVFDPFFRYTSAEHKPVFQEMPGETVDPFTGNLRIVQEDVSLPGPAGLNLQLIRTYSSKIWARVDIGVTMDPLLAESEHSVLGYGWSFHFGRLRDPNVNNTAPCSRTLPVFEAPDGTSQVFYPLGDGSLISKEYWRMERQCAALGGTGICIWSPQGVRYEFTGGVNEYYHGLTLFYPVTAVHDLSGNRIVAAYSNLGGTLKALQLVSLTDGYGRQVTFDYVPDNDGDRLTAAHVPTRGGSKTYQYHYTWYQTFAGQRRFLTDVQSPSGVYYRYAYGISSTLAQNQGALTSITYPWGGTTVYTYKSVNFFTGLDTVAFSVVATRTVGGYNVTPGTWTYDYTSPAPGQALATDPNPRFMNLHLTAITRPDGKQDTYKFYGFGWVGDQKQGGYNYVVGLPYEIARGNRQEIELFGWDVRDRQPLAPGVIYSAPLYSTSGACANYLYDGSVYAPAQSVHIVARDNPSFQPDTATGCFFETVSSNFDDYGQPQTVTELGYNEVALPAGSAALPVAERVTTWTYFQQPSDATGTVNLVRGRPLTQHVCIGDPANCQCLTDGSNCLDNSWTYAGAGYQCDTETLSGVTTQFDYYPSPFLGAPNGGGDLKRVTNARGVYVALSDYTGGYGVPKSVEFGSPGGAVFTNARTASPEGWVLTQTDGRNNTTTYDYDADGRPLSITPPTSTWPIGQGSASIFSYSADGCWLGSTPNCFQTVTRGSYSQTSFLDGQGRVTSTSDSEGVQTSVEYDNMGRPSFKSYPYDSAGGKVGEHLSYDNLGRLSSRQLMRQSGQRLGGHLSVSYWPAANGLTTQTFDGTGNYVYQRHYQQWFGQPDENRLWEVVDEKNEAWWYGYTAAGKLQAVQAALIPGDRSYGYDSHQFPAWDQSGESGTTQYTPNEIGQIATKTDARGVLATFNYDALSRPVGVIYQTGTPDDWSQSYDKSNNVKHVESVNGGIYDYGIDELNRVRQQTWSTPTAWDGGRAHIYTTSFDFDSMGCLRAMTYPSGLQVTMTCDSDNRPTSLSINSSAVVQNVQYHPSGQPKQMTYANGATILSTTTFTFDDLARVKTVSTPGVLDLAYGYDGYGNAGSLCRDGGDGSCLAQVAPANLTRTMGYDAASRLMSVVTPQANLWGALVYDYDALGNRVFKSGYFNGTTDLSTIFTYDANNRLASTTNSPERFRSMTFTWDPAGRLASSSDGTTYRYDGHGWRVLRATSSQSTVFHYDPSGRVIAETLPDGTKLRDYIYFGNKLVAVDGCISSDSPPCNERQWYHTDILGSVVARTDGTVVAQLEYQPWGEQWSPASSGNQGDRQYNGRIYDPATGFHDYGARMYWPQIGRFISADIAGPNPANPATFNRYSYVTNNPYKYVDPTGMWGEDVHRDATTKWAKDAGFSAGAAAVIGAANIAADDGDTGPLPWQNQSRHFNTSKAPGVDSRQEHFEADFGAAVALERAALGAETGSERGQLHNRALRMLGRALHSLQDIDAHSAPFVRSYDDGSVYFHSDPKNPLDTRTNLADDVSVRPERFAHTEQETRNALNRFLVEVSK